MKPKLRFKISLFYQALWFMISPVMVSGCAAYVPPQHAVVADTAPAYGYQAPPVYSAPPTGVTETAPARSSAAGPTASVQAQSASPQTTPPIPVAVVVSQPPPVPQSEVVPVAPGPDYAWTPGYWSWNGGDWVWSSGRWSIRPRHGAI